MFWKKSILNELEKLNLKIDKMQDDVKSIKKQTISKSTCKDEIDLKPEVVEFIDRFIQSR